MDIFKLYRNFWDFAFENPEKIKPNHIAIFSFAIEHCNRLGWKQKYGLPSAMVMEATGIKSYNTYISTFNELVNFGFIKLIQKSKNQYSSNIIALSNFDKASNKALDKALIKHTTKQSESTVQSIDSINIPIYKDTNIQIDKDIDFKSEIFSYSDTYSKDMLEKFYLHWSEKNSKGKMKYQLQPTWETKKRLSTWHSNSLKWEIKKPQSKEEIAIIKSWFEKSRFQIEMKYKTIEEHNAEVNTKGYDTKYILK